MFNVNPKAWMNAKVAMTDVGSATALISVLRMLLRNTKMISTARTGAEPEGYLHVFDGAADKL